MIETRKKSLILNIVLGAIVFIIAVLFWPDDKEVVQSNKVDSSLTQIKINVKRLNIREEPSEDSKDIGDVYYDEVFTVLSHVDKEKYYWYKIKTSLGVEGYIASGKDEEYVTLLSGYIDRTPPVIESSKDYLLFVNGSPDYTGITCKDDYSKCELSYEVEQEFVKVTAQDSDKNEGVFKIRYYNIYDFSSRPIENSDKLNVNLTLKKINNKDVISAYYTLNKTITSDNKSNTYTPIITFYDEDMNLLKDIFVSYNLQTLPTNCINDSNMNIKKEYEESDLLNGTSLCLNYTFDNSLNLIKYVGFGFSSDENYNNKDNYLASYYSEYYKIE